VSTHNSGLRWRASDRVGALVQGEPSRPKSRNHIHVIRITKLEYTGAAQGWLSCFKPPTLFTRWPRFTASSEWWSSISPSSQVAGFACIAIPAPTAKEITHPRRRSQPAWADKNSQLAGRPSAMLSASFRPCPSTAFKSENRILPKPLPGSPNDRRNLHQVLSVSAAWRMCIAFPTSYGTGLT
jgi:hypothetical protein